MSESLFWKASSKACIFFQKILWRLSKAWTNLKKNSPKAFKKAHQNLSPEGPAQLVSNEDQYWWFCHPNFVETIGCIFNVNRVRSIPASRARISIVTRKSSEIFLIRFHFLESNILRHKLSSKFGVQVKGIKVFIPKALSSSIKCI